MQIEPFGFVVVGAGVLTLFLGYRWTIYFAFAFTILGAAAGISLSFLGGATITPPHLFSAFVILKAILQKNRLDVFVHSFSLRKPAGWLALVACYGIFVSFVAPQLFPETLVYAFGRQENGVNLRLEPLRYASGQITQGVYSVGAVLLLGATYALLRRPGAWAYVLRAFLACSVLNLLFVVLDLISYYSGNTELLSFVRDAAYAQTYQTVESGLKRISGSFPEASAFSAYSCLLLGFWASLWMQHFRPWLSGAIALCTLLALLLSTSGTAYVSLAILLSLFIARDFLALASKRRPQRLAFILVSLPVLLFFALVFAVAHPGTMDTIGSILDEMVFNKLNTSSGIERSAWNTQAWQDFLDTDLVGVGIGGGRASSYIFVLLSNVGLIGTLCFLVFLQRAITRKDFEPSSDAEKCVGIACRWALVAGLIPSVVSAGVFELGSAVYLTAAAAAAVGARDLAVGARRFAFPARARAVPASR